MTIDKYANERAKIIAKAAEIDVNETNVYDYTQRWMDDELDGPEAVALCQYIVDSGRIHRVHPLMRAAVNHLIHHGLVRGTPREESGSA